MFNYIIKITFKTNKTIKNLKKKLIFIKQQNNFKNIKIFNTFYIKKKKKIITVLKSPHIYKKSREHFIYTNNIIKINIFFVNFIELFNYIILIKKVFFKNNIINIKIIKKKCL